MPESKVRVRYAPSPTGYLHVGALRTALYNFLFAKKQQGSFVLRVEDTDQQRLVAGSVENILSTLQNLKLIPDEGPVMEKGQIKEKGDFGPYFQSRRLNIYKKYALELVEKKHAYYCFCSPERLSELRKSLETQKLPPKYDKHCLKLSPEEVTEKIEAKENFVIRLNVPNDQTIRFSDMVHGELSFSSNDIDDQVLLKSDGFPTYHLAVVVDDHLMEITHVFRGEEWIPSTPKHILLYSALNWESPKYVHLPLLLGTNRKKLSKREGDVSVEDFLNKGYLPEALINFVALLGWNPKTEQEVFALDQLIDEFRVENINKSGAVFDLTKLDWLNGLYIRKMSDEDLLGKVRPHLGIVPKLENYPEKFLLAVVGLEKERLKKFSEIGERVMYFFSDPQYDPTLLVWKNSDAQSTQKNLQKAYEFLRELPIEKYAKEFLEPEFKNFISSNSLTNGEILWPIRVSLTGLEASPGPYEIIDAFAKLPNGKDIVLNRILTAVEKL